MVCKMFTQTLAVMSEQRRAAALHRVAACPRMGVQPIQLTGELVLQRQQKTMEHRRKQRKTREKEAAKEKNNDGRSGRREKDQPEKAMARPLWLYYLDTKYLCDVVSEKATESL